MLPDERYVMKAETKVKSAEKGPSLLLWRAQHTISP